MNEAEDTLNQLEVIAAATIAQIRHADPVGWRDRLNRVMSMVDEALTPK